MKDLKQLLNENFNINESINNAEDAIDVIIGCLFKHDALYDICDAANHEKIDLHTFTDEHGKEILDRLNKALHDCWSENF